MVGRKVIFEHKTFSRWGEEGSCMATRVWWPKENKMEKDAENGVRRTPKTNSIILKLLRVNPVLQK